MKNICPVIMLQIGERPWTVKALHAACRQARQIGAELALVKMIPVQQPGWLGTELGYLNYSVRDQADMMDYVATVEDYFVDFTMYIFQYMSLVNGLAQAAEAVNAGLVYATVPESIIPYRHQFQWWQLRRRLAAQGRNLVENLFCPNGGLPSAEATTPEIESFPRKLWKH